MVRGDVHEIRLPRGRGRVQHGRRFAVVVQADALLGLSTVLVCPTSASTPSASFHPEVTIAEKPTRAVCEMVGAAMRRLSDLRSHIWGTTSCGPLTTLSS